MGERLVASIERGGETIACVYFHWSGYTDSAYDEVAKLIEVLDAKKKETDEEKLLRLIRYLESRGGGISGHEGELDYIKSLYPGEEFKTEDVSRNAGIIDMSPDGIRDAMNWAEECAYIDLDNRIASVDAWGTYDSLEDMAECYGCSVDEFLKDYGDNTAKTIEVLMDIESFDFDDADIVSDIVYSLPDTFSCNGAIYHKIC